MWYQRLCIHLRLCTGSYPWVRTATRLGLMYLYRTLRSPSTLPCEWTFSMELLMTAVVIRWEPCMSFISHTRLAISFWHTKQYLIKILFLKILWNNHLTTCVKDTTRLSPWCSLVFSYLWIVCMKYIQWKHTEKSMYLCLHVCTHACFIFIITQQVFIKFGTEEMSIKATGYNWFYLQAIHCNPNITCK